MLEHVHALIYDFVLVFVLVFVFVSVDRMYACVCALHRFATTAVAATATDIVNNDY